MTFDNLRELLDFHYWARDRVFDAVAPLTLEQFTRNLGSSFPSVRETLVHIYGSERGWSERWQGRSPTALASPEGFPDLQSITLAWAEQERTTRAFLESLGEGGVERVFDFKRLDGQSARATFRQMLQHLVNHGSYHRGQITTMLRQLGAHPGPSMDLMAFFLARPQRPTL